MPITLTVTPDKLNYEAGETITLTTSAISDSPKTLMLSELQNLLVNKDLPYDFTITYEDETFERYVVSLDESDTPIVQIYNEDSILEVNNQPIFSSDFRLLEAN